MSSDSDIAVIGRAMKEARQSKRAVAKAKNTARLVASGIKFTVHNDGSHLIIPGWDYWPSTDRWSSRDHPSHVRKIRGVGFDNFIAAMVKGRV